MIGNKLSAEKAQRRAARTKAVHIWGRNGPGPGPKAHGLVTAIVGGGPMTTRSSSHVIEATEKREESLADSAHKRRAATARCCCHSFDIYVWRVLIEPAGASDNFPNKSQAASFLPSQS
jgi:hypothetical protein